MHRVLVVEDDALIGEEIRATLERLGYAVSAIVGTGEDAVRGVAEHRPDLVLMDMQLRGKLDGIQATSRIHELWNIPVVFLTAHSDATTLNRAKEVGAHGYVLKPFREDLLRIALELALRKHAIDRRDAIRARCLAVALHSVRDGVIVMDTDGTVAFMNRSAEGLTGWTRNEVRGRQVHEIFKLVDEQGAEIGELLTRAARTRFGLKAPSGARLLTKSGDRLMVDDESAAVIDEEGQLQGKVLVFRDVSAASLVEQRLAQSERLASIGTLATGLAHEINNPLASSMANVSFAMERLAQVLDGLAKLQGAESAVTGLAEAREALLDADEAGARVRRVVHDLKRFSRTDQATRHVLDLTTVLEAALKLTEHQIRHNARLQRAYAQAPLVEANEGQLTQVFTNLLINAAQAIGESRACEPVITVSTDTDAEGRAVAEIHDTGVGIPPETLERIFTPFFTTKPIGTGSGLGLSICHDIITAMGGQITAKSKPGGPTTFRICLPPAEGRRERIPSERPLVNAARRGRVLVIDDEEAVCRSIKRILSDAHEVTSETEAASAVKRVREGEEFDLIVCDVMMPHMTGADVYETLLASHPGMADKIVFMTGGAFSSRAERFLSATSNLTIMKPFAPDVLRGIVASYLK